MALDGVAFAPRRIALYGNTSRPGTIGNRIRKSLLEHAFPGELVEVTERTDVESTLRVIPHAADLGEPIDLAIVVARAEAAQLAIEDCAAGNIPTAIVVSSNFAEQGSTGASRQRELMQAAADGGVRLIGPNCLGFISANDGVFATGGVYTHAEPGPVSVISQSGAVACQILEDLNGHGLGIDLWITIGNEADVGSADLLAHMVERASTQVIVMYLESVRDLAGMRKALSTAQAAGKHVIVLKGGRTARGAVAAQSHTAALTSPDSLYQLLWSRYGVVQATTITNAVDCAKLLTNGVQPRGRIAIVTTSGGACSLSADLATQLSLPLSSISAKGAARMRELVPFCATENPIDPTTSAREKGLLAQFLPTITEEPDVSAVLYTCYHTLKYSSADLLAPALIDWAHVTDKPIVVAAPVRDDWSAKMEAAGLSLLPNMERAVAALACIIGAGGNVSNGAEGSPATQTDADEPATVAIDASAMFERAGLPMVASSTVTDIVSAQDAAAAFGYPVVLKAIVEGHTHKSDIGAVRTGISDADQLATQVRDFQARFAEYAPLTMVLQPMVQNPVAELIVGGLVDPTFGPYVTVGAGGVLTELLADVACDFAPIDERGARALLSRLRIFPILDGWRGGKRAALEPICAAIARFSELVASTPGLLEAEMNPLIAGEDGAVAVDARCVIRGVS